MVSHIIQLVLGIWILVSPWILGSSDITIMLWSNVIVGVAIILVNLWAIFGGGQFGEGERSVENAKIKDQNGK